MHSEPVEDFRADLHCHSFCSDGSMSPKELVDSALQEGLKALSITDHDTIEAYSEVSSYAKERGLILGPGVELSTEHKKQSVHILGYDFSIESESLKAYCVRQQKKRVLRNKEILERLRRVRIIIEEKDLEILHPNISTQGRPHIAAALVQKGYVRSIQEAFQLYIGDKGCCFVPGERFSVEEAIAVLHQAGGKAFLAHPSLFSDATFARNLLLLGFDGIECYYGRATPHRGNNWLKLARERDLLISGGSDFHGNNRPQSFLGSSYVDKPTFDRIFTSHLIQ